ncbi:MAG: sorbosone dehydrogenase family protein [Gemmatimonadota bacterium]
MKRRSPARAPRFPLSRARSSFLLPILVTIVACGGSDGEARAVDESALASDSAASGRAAGVSPAPGCDPDDGGVVALRDTDGDGKADVRERFGGRGGTGIALAPGALFFAPDDRVLRFSLAAGSLEPSGSPETVVSGLPDDRSHTAKAIAVGEDGALFVNVGSPTNSCQEQDRETGAPGLDPCPDLRDRAGVWRFDAAAEDQRQEDGERFATGLRNTLALAVHPETGELYGLQHGRDQLHQNWPRLFDQREGAEKPSEIFVRIDRGDDFGWPYCYHDPELDRTVLAPEYGGDGRAAGRCANVEQPLSGYPGHWAPMSLVFYTGESFPAEYRGGAFISFHGSWNRAPRPQAGYKVVSGLAQGPDGSLYVTDDNGGRLWRILYHG